MENIVKCDFQNRITQLDVDFVISRVNRFRKMKQDRESFPESRRAKELLSL